MTAREAVVLLLQFNGTPNADVIDVDLCEVADRVLVLAQSKAKGFSALPSYGYAAGYLQGLAESQGQTINEYVGGYVKGD
jgi:hypothetical protein